MVGLIIPLILTLGIEIAVITRNLWVIVSSIINTVEIGAYFPYSLDRIFRRENRLERWLSRFELKKGIIAESLEKQVNLDANLNFTIFYSGTLPIFVGFGILARFL